MKTTTSLLLFLVMVAAVLIPSSAYAAQAPDPPDPSQDFTITGAGASFPYPLIDLWRVEYNKEFPNANLNYQSIGSGGGVRLHTNNIVNFGASDAPLTQREMDNAPGSLHIPEAIGGVVITYNLPEVPEKGLNLTGEIIADIYLGKITSWNDSRIAGNNPGVPLPDENIVLVKRADGSGTTFVFTDYLSAVSPEFYDAVGTGKSVDWPARSVGGKGNEGVAGIVRSSPYSIGYVELAYAFQTGMAFAFIQNADGTSFIEPTLETISAASEGVASSLPAADGDWSKVTLVNAPGKNSYPIASFTYLLVYDDLLQSTDSVEQAKALIHMLHWMITDGQKHSESLLYVPLSDAVRELGRQGLAQVTYDGEVLFDYDGVAYTISSDTNDGVEPVAEPEPVEEPAPEGGGCLIATAAFGSEIAPQVQALREIRDGTLLQTDAGSSFMGAFGPAYYSFSPQVADLAREVPEVRATIRAAITPGVYALGIMSAADPESEASVIALGTAAILALGGLYVGAPVALALAATRTTGAALKRRRA